MGREALWGAKLPLVGGLRVLNGGGGAAVRIHVLEDPGG